MHFATYCTQVPKKIYLNLCVQIRLHFSGRALGLRNSRKSVLNVAMTIWLTINTSCPAILMTINVRHIVQTYQAWYSLHLMSKQLFSKVSGFSKCGIPTSFQPHSQYILREKKSTAALLCEWGPTLGFTTGSEQRANRSGRPPVIRVIPARFYHFLPSFICDFCYFHRAS